MTNIKPRGTTIDRLGVPPPDLGQEALDIPPYASEQEAEKAGDQILYSVTTVIGVIDKPALKYWSAGLSADAAIDDESVWKAILRKRGRREAWKWIRDALNRPNVSQLKSADLGAILHRLCEVYARDGERPTAEQIAGQVRLRGGSDVDVAGEVAILEQMLDRFDEWCQKAQPSYVAAEVTVYDSEYGYAGQLDGIADVEGVRLMLDYKSSREPYDAQGKPRTPYPEQVGLQLAGYRWAKMAAVWRPRRYEQWWRRYYVLSAAERAQAVPVPPVDAAVCIHITPEACESWPIQCDEEVHEAFLHTLEVFRWVNETSKTAMRPPLRFSAGDDG